MRLYLESLRATSNLPTFIAAARGIAVAKAKEGFHKQAVSELESLLPLIRYASPFTYFAVLNSLAVEMGEVGRIEEASNICRVVLASPFIHAYPEWRETSDEIQLKAYRSPRSVVSFAQKNTATILQLPERETGPNVARPWLQSAQVLNLLDWKRKMVKEPNGDNDTNVDELSEKDLLLRAMQLFSNPEISESKRRKMLDAIEKIVSAPED